MMGFVSRKISLILTILAIVSCGAKVNTREDSSKYANELNYILMEQKCDKELISFEPVTIEIVQTHEELQKKYLPFFMSIQPKFYDYKTPLIINLKDLKISLTKIQNLAKDEIYMAEHAKEIIADLHYLYQNSMRFEGQKCSFSSLALKKAQDIRPYLEMKDFCNEKNQSEICSNTTVAKLSAVEAQKVEERTVKMCNAFDANKGNCQAEYNIQKQNKKLETLISHYQKRFGQERFNKLFQLRDAHAKFECKKRAVGTVPEVIIMNVKVSTKNWDVVELNKLTSYVSVFWKRDNFQVTIELVSETGSDVVEIIPTLSSVSYVPDEDNRFVYLSNTLDLETKKRVLSHEFGHVLGFPDCYIEYFDKQNKDLIYYEMGAANTNIMCSLKTGAIVPNDYFDQLAQKSCVFN